MATVTSVSPVSRTTAAPQFRRTVCQVLHCLSIGGAELLAADMVRSLHNEYRFVFACLDELGPLGQSLKDEGFPVHVLHRRPGIDFRCARRLAAVLRSEKVDLVHAHQYTPFIQATLARGPFGRTPILFTEHGRLQPDVRRIKRVIGNWMLTKSCDRIVGVGNAVRVALIEKDGFSPARVGVVYNGIDLKPFQQRSDSIRSAVRRELNLGDAPLLMQIARLNYMKDHATAFRAMKRVLSEVPAARLVLVGDGEEREPLMRLARELNLEKEILFLGARRDIPRLLSAADIFLLSSQSEGIPLTIIEAMAARVPVVTTNAGGIGEMIEPGVTGLLSPVGDDAALAGNLLKLIRSPDERRLLAESGAIHAERHFSRDRMNEEYRNHYEEMLNG